MKKVQLRISTTTNISSGPNMQGRNGGYMPRNRSIRYPSKPPRKKPVRTRRQRRNGALIGIAIVWGLGAVIALIWVIARGVVWLFDRGYVWQGWLAALVGISAFFGLIGYFCEE